MDAMVIVGAGEAGACAAVALRERGWTGRVVLVGDEPHPTYERPPLSKAVPAGEAGPRPIATADAARFADLRIEHVSGTTVAAIDRAERRIRLADGRSFAYVRLLLATGAAPRPLTVPGGERARVLRRFEDAVALRGALAPGRALAVIGAGFIGLEVAAAARSRGMEVTVIEAAPRVLGRAVPAGLAATIADRHRAEGVRILTGAGVAAIEPAGTGSTVVLADGRRIPADTVLAGIGARPNTALAAAAGLAVDEGIAVDTSLRTADPDVFAAGDCCSFPHPLYAFRRIRLESWRNARDQGAAAAAGMLGKVEPFAAVPWFWSDQYDFHLQIAGLPDAGERVVERDAGEGARILFHLAGEGRLVAASGLGPIGRIAREIRLAEMLIARDARPDPVALGAPEVKLKSLLAA